MKIVVVKWRDASVQTEDVPEDRLEKECVMVTAGILVNELDGHISIAQDIYQKHPSFRYVTHIPKGMVISKKIVEVKLAK
jgi:hypothetical protein